MEIKQLPPGAAHGSEPAPQFNDSKARKSIHTTKNPDGTFTSTGLDVSDVYQTDGGARMHMFARKLAPGRKNPVPPWVFSDELTRKVISEYVIARANRGRQAHWKSDKTVSARFTEACETSKKVIPELKAKLKELCTEFHRLAVAGTSKKRLDEIERQVRNLEASIKLHERGVAAVATAIAYYYFRVGYNSVQIAEQLHLSSVGVRQIISRLNKSWWYLQHPGQESGKANEKSRARNARKCERRKARTAQIAARMSEPIDAELNEFVNEMTGETPSHLQKDMR